MDRHDKAHETAEQNQIAGIMEGRSAAETFGRIIFLIVIVELVVLMGLNLYQRSRVGSLEKKITAAEQKLASGDYKLLNDQVDDVLAGAAKLEKALASKADWAIFYRQLNAITPKDVRIKAVAINDKGAFKLDAETTSLTSLAQTLVAWRGGLADAKTPFTGVTLNNNSFITEGNSRRVSFSVSGQINLGGLR